MQESGGIRVKVRHGALAQANGLEDQITVLHGEGWGGVGVKVTHQASMRWARGVCQRAGRARRGAGCTGVVGQGQDEARGLNTGYHGRAW